MYRWSPSKFRGSAARRTVAALCALAAGVVGWLAVEPGGSQAAVAASGPSATDNRSASQRAAASGERVEVLQKRTEDSQTFANPDGTFTLEQSSVPVRTKQNGQWVNLDITLSRGADGMVRPRAAAMEMAFSGGGAGPLVVLDSDGRKLEISWPTTLPAPVVQGDSLTYPSVYPGVDLRVNVTTLSFSQVLIVRTRQAGLLPQLQKIELDVNAPGMQVRRATGGGIDVIDDLGSKVFSAPKPTMWDSKGDGEAQAPSADRTEEPLEGDSVATMPLEVTQDSVAVTPVRSLMDDPATVYPLHVDPGFTAGRIARSMINQHYPSTSGWGWGGDEGVGYQSYEPWSRKRLLFGFTVSSIAGADVSVAVLSTFETWSASCTPKVVEVWKTARFTDTTTWDNGSGSSVWQQKLSYATAAHGRDGCDPGGHWVTFNVMSAVEPVVAASGSSIYLGMRASDENDELAWKRFRYDAKLSVTYNYPPTVINPHTEYPTTECVTTSASDPVIGDNTPVPVVSITDPDTAKGEKVQAQFEMRRASDQAPFWTHTTPWVDGGADVDIKPPVVDVPKLWSNTTYVWRARAYDGKTYSAWTTPCLFYVDTAKPYAPSITIETAAPYTLNNAITVKFGPTGGDTDIAGYKYAINDDVPRSVMLSPSAPWATTTPTAFGPLIVYAWGYDQAGNQSAAAKLTINVASTPAMGTWLMNEGTGLSTKDESANGRVMYLGPQVTWVEGNKGQPDYAVDLQGLQTSGETTATAASNIVNTSQNFSVAVRVKLGIKSNRQVIVSEDHPGRSSFSLGTSEMTWDGKETADPADDNQDQRKVKWMFTVSTSSGPVSTISNWIPYDADDWAHVTGVFNRSTGALELYVNGVLQTVKDSNGLNGFVRVPGGVPVVDGTGPFRTGLGIDNSATTYFFRGFVDDVYLYNGRIDKNIIDSLYFND